jgi:glycosyltransferase involved in cell wall biosynthesis
LSLIIPCYNESKNLPMLIERCKKIYSIEQDIEIIIVDNGSSDETSLVLDRITSGMPFFIRVNIKKNKGYGNGILMGLAVAEGEVIGWTHADLQTDPSDVLKGLDFFQKSSSPEFLFVKGQRYDRPILDNIFTIGMSIFETILLKRVMWDINAQPTMFHRSFFLDWNAPPNDFSLDLYAYYLAIRSGLKIERFPVHFGKRIHGVSNWNFSFLSKYRFIKRTLLYSFNLRRKMS